MGNLRDLFFEFKQDPLNSSAAYKWIKASLKNIGLYRELVADEEIRAFLYTTYFQGHNDMFIDSPSLVGQRVLLMCSEPDDNKVEWYLLKGYVLNEVITTADGIAAFKKVLSLDPGNIVAQYNWAHGLAERKQYEESIALLKQVIVQLNTFGKAIYNLVYCYAMLGVIDEDTLYHMLGEAANSNTYPSYKARDYIAHDVFFDDAGLEPILLELA